MHNSTPLCVLLQKGTAWPDFKGTWDLPPRIPAHRINPTSRSVDGLYRLKSWGFDPQHAGKSQPHGIIKSSDKLQDVKQVRVKPVNWRHTNIHAQLAALFSFPCRSFSVSSSYLPILPYLFMRSISKNHIIFTACDII